VRDAKEIRGKRKWPRELLGARSTSRPQDFKRPFFPRDFFFFFFRVTQDGLSERGTTGSLGGITYAYKHVAQSSQSKIDPLTKISQRGAKNGSAFFFLLMPEPNFLILRRNGG